MGKPKPPMNVIHRRQCGAEQGLPVRADGLFGNAAICSKAIRTRWLKAPWNDCKNRAYAPCQSSMQGS